MNRSLLSFFVRYKFYILSFLFLVIWIGFIDRSNLIRQAEMILKLNDLKEEEAYYEEELAKIKKEEKEVLGSLSSMEKYAREKYFIKKDGETVFVLVDENGNILKEEE